MNWRTLLLAAISLCVSLEPTFSQDKKETAAKPEILELGGGKVIATKPAEWKSVKAMSSMIQYEFRTPAEGDKSARITIMSASGGVEPNIDRWVGQFDGSKKEDAKIEKKEVDKTIVHLVEIAGTFKETMGGGGPFAPGGKTQKMPNYKMLGAILEQKDGSLVFIKATGPSDVIAGMRDGFVKMLDGLKNK
jgi:hypothetical protein